MIKCHQNAIAILLDLCEMLLELLFINRLTFLSDRNGGEWRGGGRPGGRAGGHWDYQNTHRDKHTTRDRREEQLKMQMFGLYSLN